MPRFLLLALCAQMFALEIPPGDPLALPNEPIQDESSNFWSFNEDGSLAEDEGEQGGIFKFAGRLSVNNQPFNAVAAHQIQLPGVADPWFVVGPQQTDHGLQIARFVQVSRKHGFCRWLDVVANTGRERAQAPIRIQHEFNLPPRTLDWRRDERKKECAAVFQFGNRRPMCTALWWGAEGKMQAREGNVSPLFDIVVDIDPGECVGLMHAVAIFAQADKATRDFSAWTPEQMARDLPWLPDLHIVNLHVGLTAIDALRSPDIEAVQLITGERLRGAIMTTTFTVKSPFGDRAIPRLDLAGIMRRADGDFTVFTRDGSITAGTLAAESVSLALPSGDQIAIPVRELRMLAMRSWADGPAETPKTGWEIITNDQQRLMASDLAGGVTLTTALGALDLPAASVSAIEGYQDGPLTVKLWDGSRLRAVSRNDNLTAVTADGQKLQLSFTRLRSLRALSPAPDGKRTDGVMLVTLINGDALFAALAEPMAIDSHFKVVQVRPQQTLGVNVDGDKGQVTVHFSDGSYLQGRFHDDIALTTSWGARLNVPQTLLSSIGATGDHVKNRAEDEAQAMLRDLSDPDPAKAQAAGLWLSQRRVQLKDFLNRIYDEDSLPAAAQRRLGLIIGKEF